MSSRHQDVEYIPLDTGEPSHTPRALASAKYAGHLFLAAFFFAGILAGGGIGRWLTAPNITVIPIPAPPQEPVHYDPVMTLLDSFVDINHVSPAQYPNSTTTKRHERAVVTSLYTEGYAIAVATLGYSLSKVKTDARKVVIYPPSRISKATICYLEAVGWELYPVDLIKPPNDGKGIWPAFIDQYTKLRIWTLDTIGIESAVYIDADTHVRQNFDELFELPFTFAASPDVYTDERGFTINFNAGIMAFKPSSKVFADMLSKVESAHFDRIAAEQSYLNLYYGAQVVRLPHVYNGNLAIKWRAAPYWNAIQAQLRIIHYTLVKPFDGSTRCAEETCTAEEVYGIERHRDALKAAEEGWGGAFRGEIQEWGVNFEEMMREVGDRCMR